MNGYYITYKDEKGRIKKTFMVKPMSSEGIEIKDEKQVIINMFEIFHPGCKVISAEAGCYDENEIDG